MSETHIEMVLNAVATTGDLVPYTLCVAFVERLDEMCAVC